MKRFMSIFLQGLIAILPLAVTVILIGWLGGTAERTLGVAIKWVLPDAWYVQGMGVAAGLVVIFLAGLLVNIYGVPRLIRWLETFIARIPLVKTVYGAMRDLLGFFSASEGGQRSKVVIVSFGEGDTRAVGLLTRERLDDLPAGLGGESDVAVYLPMAYSTGGMMLIVPRDRIQPLEMSLEDAMRFVITAGAKSGATHTPSVQSAPTPP